MIKLEDREKQLIPQELEDFEKQLGLKLPKAYKEFIFKNNGGYPENELYFKEYEIDEFFSIKYGEETITEQLRLLDGFFDNDVSIPFADSNGGIIYIDTKDGNKIYIKYSDGQTQYLTDSFSDFLNNLKEE
jgi:hypothetical protein